MFLSKSIQGCLKRINLVLPKIDKASTGRLLSTSMHFKATETKSPKSPWNRIYYFPYIRWAAALSRFKIYQTVVTVSCVPIGISMYNSGLVELSTVEFAVGASLFTTASLYYITSFLRKVIGIVSLSDDEKYVQISHLTFWGRKNDINVAVEELVPVLEGGCMPSDVFVKLQRYSSEDVLYITFKHGKVLDKTRFEKVFGSLEILEIKNDSKD